MTSIRAAKAKGSAFEYDCQESLQASFPDIYRTSERGFQLQYDLRSDEQSMVVECKRLKGMSWNQARKYFLKLMDKAPEGYHSILLFKSNQQPCLAMFLTIKGLVTVREFQDVFGVPFVKHKSTRNFQKKGKNLSPIETKEVEKCVGN